MIYLSMLGALKCESQETYGEFDPESDFWRQVAPTNYLDGVTSAIQLNHAVDDPVVAIGYSRNLVGILEDTKIIHELNEYPSGGHNISGPTFSLAIQATAEFYREHLR